MTNVSGFEPCPFCGGSEITIDGGGYGEGTTPAYVSMYCGGCFITTPDFPDVDILREYWNKRAHLPPEE